MFGIVVFVFNRFLFFRFSFVLVFIIFFVFVLVFVNEFVIFSFFTIFVFVNENHTASALFTSFYANTSIHSLVLMWTSL